MFDGLQPSELSRKVSKFIILCSFLDVEGQGYDLEHIFIEEIIILFEVVEEGFFVADEMVEFQMVVHL